MKQKLKNLEHKLESNFIKNYTKQEKVLVQIYGQEKYILESEINLN